MFSLTFLLLLYAKHCKRVAEAEGEGAAPEEAPAAAPAAFHVDAGLDRAIVEALPMFTFASLQGVKVRPIRGLLLYFISVSLKFHIISSLPRL